MSRNLSIVGLLSLLLTFWVIPVDAANNKKPVSLEQASEIARTQSKGKVLSAKTTNFNGIKQHRIQVLTPSGRVKIIQIPAKIDNNRNRQNYSQDRNQRSPSNANRQNYSNSRNNRNYTPPKNRNTTSTKVKNTRDSKQK